MTWTHGYSGYNKGCHCRTCKDGWARYHREYRKSRTAGGGWRILRGKFVYVPGKAVR